MQSDIIVDVQSNEISIALLEDSRLVSLQKEARNLAYAVGDIYLAKVKKLMPGLNAAFVNVGYDKDAFLHYLDLGSQFSSYSEFLSKSLDKDCKNPPEVSQMTLLPDIDKHGTISDRLTQGQELMVQIVKEPISSKGPRLTTEISLTGRYMVLMPFSDKVSISQKIKSPEEKVRLRQLIKSILPKNFGVIIRTSAEGKRVAELNHEMKTLVRYWDEAVTKARTATAPALIFEEESRIVGVLRDIFSPTFENIHVNDREIYEQIRNYVGLIAPERIDIVKLYTDEQPIFDHFGITRQIKSSFGKTVSFKSGAYIIIEHTEALHVIDVNSGNRTKASNDQESNALEVNLRAADEIARQLRLRDMGGIIVIDFIDMAKSEHRQALYDHMREIMANDRARHNILPLSKFGLMQITRQRVRPALDIETAETCPSCYGKGTVRPSLLFTDTLKEKLHYLIDDLKVTDFIMYVHPFVDAYIKKGIISMYRRWKMDLGRKFKILPDQSLAYLEYKVIDRDRNIIDLKEEKDIDSAATKNKRKAKNRSKQEESSSSTD
ncbi:MAG: Rne/Rng family ribonuclease [Paramuribaculum sp.]|nr:Rne/Rng family ribonuclease [Paramuribaculum sp.]MDE6322745.1 Rne/Rng family ribonuclease [Paramuribaculum sp.]MDE6487651.1 Rne/Rng family ribonuclease [Paramuribaculum sp.]